jgi:hypothetical protein
MRRLCWKRPLRALTKFFRAVDTSLKGGRGNASRGIDATCDVPNRITRLSIADSRRAGRRTVILGRSTSIKLRPHHVK